MKRIQSEMDTGVGLFYDAAPSFLIESLVYNCRDELFGGPDLYNFVTKLLMYLQIALKPDQLADSMREVNAIKPLFGPSQPWTVDVARSYVTGAMAHIGI